MAKKDQDRKKTAKARASRKSQSVRKNSPKKSSNKAGARKFMNGMAERNRSFLSRRPHRSFRMTKRRDYTRRFSINGYIAFTKDVISHLWLHKAVFSRLILLYSVLTVLFVGIASQANYLQLSDMIKETGSDLFSGGWGEVGKAGLLVLAGITGGLAQTPSESQQIYGAVIFIGLWLATVWLMRAQLKGAKPKMRDGLYNSGTPIFATIVVFILFVLQLIPAALAVIVYNSALGAGLLDQGVVAMAFSIAAFLLVVLSIYLAISSFMALVIVTLPGMYPWRALQISGDLVVGRRLRLLLRMVWALVCVALTWIIVMVPIFLTVNWFQSSFAFSENWPVIPALILLMSSISIVFIASYVYLLYRKVVDSE